MLFSNVKHPNVKYQAVSRMQIQGKGQKAEGKEKQPQAISNTLLPGNLKPETWNLKLET
jgi:hypothetical protein